MCIRDRLATRGWKRQSGRSANTKGNDNIISNGSIVAVADGQCAMIVEQGKVCLLYTSIPHIGLDKPAPDARLKGRCKGQALHHGHITGDRMHPRHI